MANIFSLYGSIFIDNEKANKSIDETTEKGKKSSEGWTKNLGNIVNSVGKVGVAVGTAATAVVSGVSAMASKFSEGAKEIQVMAERVGWNTTQYQEWDYIAKQAGTTMDTLQGGITDLAEKMDDARTGSGEAAEIFKKLGINVTDTNGNLKDQNVVFEETINALQQVEDATERQALATKLLSTTGEELLPVINGEAGSINELKQQAHDLGIVMGEDAINAGATFQETLTKIQGAFGGVFNNIMTAILPILQILLNLIMENMPTIQSLIESLAPVLTNLLSSIIPPFIQLVQTLLPVIIELINQLLPFISTIIETILPVVVDLLNMLLPPLLKIIEMILPILMSLIEPLLPLLQPILNLLQPLIDLLLKVLEPLIELINLILPPIIELITTVINFILPPLQTALEYTANILTNVFNKAFEFLTPIIENFKGILQGIITFVKAVFTGDWEKAWQGIKQIFENIVGTFVNIFKAPINFIIDGLNNFISWLNKLKIPDWVPGIGGLGFNFKYFDKLRHGLDYVPYDEYPAMLHRGERVLTASENQAYTKGLGNITFNIYEPHIYDDKGVDLLMDKVVARLRREGAY